MKKLSFALLLSVLLVFLSCEDKDEDGKTVYSVIIENKTYKHVEYTFNEKTESISPREDDFSEDEEGELARKDQKTYFFYHSPAKPVVLYSHVQSIDVLEEIISKTKIKYFFVDIDAANIESLDIDISIKIEGDVPDLKLYDQYYDKDTLYFKDYIYLGIAFDGVKIGYENEIIIPFPEQNGYSVSGKLYTDFFNIEVNKKGYGKFSHTYYDNDGSVLIDRIRHYFYFADPPPFDMRDGKYLLYKAYFDDMVYYTFDVELLNAELIDNTMIINLKFTEKEIKTYYGGIDYIFQNAVVDIDDYDPDEIIIREYNR